MSEFGNSYSTYFQLLKTSKNIADINNKISDRLIITKQGELYFDYSDHERIKISNISSCYKTDYEYEKINTVIQLNYNELFTLDGNSIEIPVINTLVFDINGNIGIITNKDDSNTLCDIYILTKNFTAEQFLNLISIKRFIQ